MAALEEELKQQFDECLGRLIQDVIAQNSKRLKMRRSGTLAPPTPVTVVPRQNTLVPSCCGTWSCCTSSSVSTSAAPVKSVMSTSSYCCCSSDDDDEFPGSPPELEGCYSTEPDEVKNQIAEDRQRIENSRQELWELFRGYCLNSLEAKQKFRKAVAEAKQVLKNNVQSRHFAISNCKYEYGTLMVALKPEIHPDKVLQDDVPLTEDMLKPENVIDLEYLQAARKTYLSNMAQMEYLDKELMEEINNLENGM
jgi:hypothetical protein